MKSEYLVIDLDGTVLEGKQRHYRCYVEILESLHVPPLPIDDYWNFKREGHGLFALLARSQAESMTERFRNTWLRLIETEPFLKLDRLHPGVADKLQQWKQEGKRLILLTQRQSADRLMWQLDHLGIQTYWDNVVVAQEKKEDHLKKLDFLNPVTTLWIGDTEADVQGAHRFGCSSCAVTCGLRSEAFLRKLNPNTLVPSLVYL